MVTLICAAGSQERWRNTGGKGLKQFIEIDGEAIIRRLYRLASERCENVVTLVNDPADECWEGLNPKAPAHEDWMGDLGKFLDGKPYWPDSGDVVILYGDAYYTEATLDTIFSHRPDQPTVYGRAQERRSESFGFRFRVPEDVEEVERVCGAVCAHPGLVKRGGPWRFFWHRHTGGATYTKADRRRLTSLATEGNGWVEVAHDATDDFDEFPQVRKWRRRWGHMTNGGSMSEMMKVKLLRSRAGADRAYKAGGEYLFPAAEALRLIEAGKAEPVGETPAQRAVKRTVEPKKPAARRRKPADKKAKPAKNKADAEA